MSREVRRVPANWQHPKIQVTDRYQPMYDQAFATAMDEWYAAWKAWDRKDMTYEEWNGGPPDPKYHRPDWTDSERTHFMMYETTSEGTPISPAFSTPEELARWLVDNNASAFANMTASYEQWLRVCRGGWAPSAVYTPETGLTSGVASL
jgi:hypothetical protein